MFLHAIGYGRLRRKFVTWGIAISDYAYDNLQQILMLCIETQYNCLPTLVSFLVVYLIILNIIEKQLSYSYTVEYTDKLTDTEFCTVYVMSYYQAIETDKEKANKQW